MAILIVPLMIMTGDNSVIALPQLDDTQDFDELDIYPVEIPEKSWLIQCIDKIGCDAAALCIRCKRYVMRIIRQFLRTYMHTAKRIKNNGRS